MFGQTRRDDLWMGCKPGTDARAWAISGAGSGQLAKNARSGQTQVKFNLSSIGGQNESRVNAESQTAAPKNQETSRCRSQAGQTAGEAGTGGAGGEEGKSE